LTTVERNIRAENKRPAINPREFGLLKSAENAEIKSIKENPMLPISCRKAFLSLVYDMRKARKKLQKKTA
jgi:hypothetical protein